MKPEHLKIETLNPHPKGGQQCGVMPDGVRVTHIPTGLVAECGAERSQMKNKNIAIAMIEWGLSELQGKFPPS